MKTFSTVINIEVLQCGILLIIGKDKNMILKIMDEKIKNVSERKKLKDRISEVLEEWAHWCYDKEWTSRIMVISDWQNDWDHWDTLMHETHHVVEYEAKDKWFMEEMEFKAYLYTSVFKKLREILKNKILNGKLLRIDENTITSDANVIKKLHEKYLLRGLEGVVVKKANGFYVSGRTGWNWVKMKEEEGMKGRLSDTLDCIVMGYFTGKGKRTQFGLGKILVGIKANDKIRTLTKVGKGLTEDMLVEIRKRLDRLESKDKPKEYEAQKDLVPDVWVIPSLVVEVSADSISKSTKHSLGLSLRFPRFIKIRESSYLR